MSSGLHSLHLAPNIIAATKFISQLLPLLSSKEQRQLFAWSLQSYDSAANFRLIWQEFFLLWNYVTIEAYFFNNSFICQVKVRSRLAVFLVQI